MSWVVTRVRKEHFFFRVFKFHPPGPPPATNKNSTGKALVTHIDACCACITSLVVQMPVALEDDVVGSVEERTEPLYCVDIM